MPADLDARIRGLVVEVVEHAPPAPDLELTSEPREVRGRGRAPARVALAIGLAVALAIGAIAILPRDEPRTPASSHGATVTIPLDSIPEGVSARRLRGVPVFVVRDGREVTVFLSRPRLPGVTRMWWCPRDQFFVGPRYGERFDITGRVFGGPAPRGLDRLRSRLRGDTVTVQLNRVLHDDRPRGTDLVANVNDGSCERRVVGGQERRQLTLPLAAIRPGVTIGRVGTRETFFVRDGRQVTVFVDRAQHLGGERVQWCPVEQVFYAPTHGEQFRADGTVLSGPAERGLDRLQVRSRHGLITVDSRRVIRGQENHVFIFGPPPACEGGYPSLS